MEAFSPGAKTVNITVGASSGNLQFSFARGKCQVRVMNNGSATAWIAFGADNTVAATLAAGIPIGPGAKEILTVPDGEQWVAAIAAGATGSIYFTPGAGGL